MSYTVFHVLHLLSLFLLSGITFAAFAAPKPENRKRFLMWSGISSLVVFITGFGLLGVMKLGFPLWVIVKFVCWLALSAFAGVVFRKPQIQRELVIATICVLFVAILMVSAKPI